MKRIPHWKINLYKAIAFTLNAIFWGAVIWGWIILLTGCTNYKYNRAVAKRNKITEAWVHDRPMVIVPVWDFIGVTLLFVTVVVLLPKE